MKSMKTVLATAILVGGSLFSFQAISGESERVISVNELVEITGLDKREVLLMVGPRSNNHLYLTSYERVKRDWNNALAANGLKFSHVDVIKGNYWVFFETQKSQSKT